MEDITNAQKRKYAKDSEEAVKRRNDARADKERFILLETERRSIISIFKFKK